MDPFTIIVKVPPPYNTTSPIILHSCILRGAIRPANDFIWTFTRISLNEDGSFNIHGPDKQIMEMVMPPAMELIAQWAGGTVVSAPDIQQHKPFLQIDNDNKNATTDELRQASQNLDQEFDNDKGKTPSPTDPPGSDITLLDFRFSLLHPPHPLPPYQ